MSQLPDLQAISSPGKLTFNIGLNCGTSFVSDEVVRVIPNRRLVCKGEWEGNAVYAKIFIGKSARHYALRDKAGVNALQLAEIKTPQLLHESDLKDGAYILVFLAVEAAENAEKILYSLDKNSRLYLAEKLVQAVAFHHRAGLLQTDLHFKNFLVKNFLVEQKSNQDDLIYTLDGDGIRSISWLFQKRQKLRNLATLFSKMDVLDDGWIAELYPQYCLFSGIVYSSLDEAEVWFLTQKIRHLVTKNYATKKVFRNCTDVKIRHSFKYFEAVMSDFLIAIQEMASLDQLLVDTKLNIKNGNTCTIAKTFIENQWVIVKRYNIKNFWHGLNRACRSSRAAKSWANAHRLIISNIATAKPLALVEERFGYLRRRAYYLSEFIDAPDAMQFFAQAAQLDDKKNVARNLALLFYKMYLLKFSHGDCKASNIKIVNLAPVLIDLDAMQAHFGGIFSDWWFDRKHIKDLKRLMKNWENDTEVTALLKQAFMLQYVAVNPNAHHGILFRAGFA